VTADATERGPAGTGRGGPGPASPGPGPASPGSPGMDPANRNTSGTPGSSRRPGRRRQPGLDLGAGYSARPWTTNDAPDLVLGLQDPLVRRYATRLIDDRPTAVNALFSWADQWQQSTGAAWAVCDPSRRIVGSVRFGLIDPDVGTGSVGYWMLPEGRGRGLASGALRAGTRTVLDRLGWHRIELYHAIENERSCAVARRCRYPAEGVMRSAMYYPVDGRRSDEHLHARLRDDPV
jgi:[ribosomal protein S5]-alanine N-acetyltransferase